VPSLKALGILISVLSYPAFGTTDYYVDADANSPAPDGSSWCTAYPALENALRFVAFGDRILVADGIYTPDPTGLVDPRKASFGLVSGTRIDGGYAGCGAADPDERDILLFETVLSGDLNGDDYTGGSIAENSYHVVTGSLHLDGSTTVDGVTITGGNANGGNLDGRGGGVFLQQKSDPSFRNCRIAGNHGIRGAGFFNQDSSPLILNSVIADNVSTGDGAGLRDATAGQVDGSTIINCLFRDNVAGGFGGAIRVDDAGTSLDSCTVVNNRAASGGGMFIQIGNPTILDCIFWGNKGGSNLQDAQVFPFSGAPNVSFSCVEGWNGTLSGTNSFGDDPLFAVGPLGCFYLSQTTAGESADSPCLDAGFDSAVAVGLAGHTTRSDAVGDAGLVDLGYHYPITSDVLFMGDYDRDEIVDLSDYGAWVDCVTGPLADDLTDCCRIADFDDDEDIDLFDLAEFANALTVP